MLVLHKRFFPTLSIPFFLMPIMWFFIIKFWQRLCESVNGREKTKWGKSTFSLFNEVKILESLWVKNFTLLTNLPLSVLQMPPQANPIFKWDFQMALLLTNYQRLPSLPFILPLRSGECYVIHLENLQKHDQEVSSQSHLSNFRLWAGGLTLYFPHFEVSMNSSLTKKCLCTWLRILILI